MSRRTVVGKNLNLIVPGQLLRFPIDIVGEALARSFPELQGQGADEKGGWNEWMEQRFPNGV